MVAFHSYSLQSSWVPACSVGFKFYASEVGLSSLPSTIIIAAVMGLVSGMTVLVTQYRENLRVQRRRADCSKR